jgi:hypothetical protein
MDEVDPVVVSKFMITPSDRVVTAGSCFAQHIARHLQMSGFSYFVTETAHPLLDPSLTTDYNYGVFSARYGNVYTSRQLVQLLNRAYGLYRPHEDIWEGPDGRFIDPFRPQIQPKGFASRTEYEVDRQQHFAAIRRAIEELNVFVFTLGLTETWVSKRDGAVYPLCPGVAGGVFDRDHHAFTNLTVTDVTNDLCEAIDHIRSRNPSARVILTVSPVPLVATAEDRSVLVSTTYSKSVLRVAAENVASGKDYVAYFPSYEIITGVYSRGAYFMSDLRSVTESGVNHVMRLFMRHYASEYTRGQRTATDDAAQRVKANVREVEQIARVICEEELLDAR